jgi:SAM-dependent methyltransferase
MSVAVQLAADRTALVLRSGAAGGLPEVVDVLLEGFRTASFRLPEPAEETVTLEWPPALAALLEGRADVQVRDSVTHRVLASAEVAFGPAERRLDLRDEKGRWLSVNKWGRLGASFDGMDAATAQERLLRRVDEVIADLREFGIEPFACYGTLLGLVRDGRLIAHDDDADLAYLSAHEHPADVVRESYALERHLRAKGHYVFRHSAGHVQLHFPDAYLDVFTAFRTGDRTYLCFQVGADELDLTGRTELRLGERLLPAPLDSERLLTATYGEGWRTPDPSFRFATPWPVRSRLMAWTGEFNVHRDYWDDFYSSPAADDVPLVESTFVRWVTERVSGQPPILDIGAGTARDSRFLARKGHRVAVVDYSYAALDRARAAAEDEGWTASFHQLNLGDLHAVGEFVSRLDWTAGWHLYARFLVHALDDTARSHLWSLATVVAQRGGECWLEFRTDRDERTEHVFGEHFRRYLSLAQVREELEGRGLHVLAFEEGRGLAPHGDEDPWIARVRVGGAPC